MAGGAKIVIGADVSAVKPALDSVSRSVVQMDAQVNGSFQGWVGNTNAVATATDKLERQLKSFASEQRSQSRVARFYASEIAELIPAAEGAKKAIAGLFGLGIEGVAGGMGIAFAIEGVKLFMSAIHGAKEEGKDNSTKQVQYAKEISDAWADLASMVERTKRALTTEGREADIAASEEEMVSSRRRIIEKQQEAEKQLEEARKKRDWNAISNAASLVEAYQRQYVQSWEEAAAKKAAIQEKWDKREAEASLKTWQETQDKILKAEQAIRDGMSKGWQAGETPDMAYSQKTWEEMAAFKESKAGSDAQQKLNEMFAKGWEGGEFPDLDNKLQAQTEKALTLSDALKSVAGSFSEVGAAIGGMAGSIVSQIANIVTLTLKFIGLAIAASEASAAQTPVVGWAMAIGAGAAVAASIFGLISGLADGGPMQAGRPYLVGERGPELVVPRNAGTVIPNHQLGGGSVTVNFNAPVDQVWWRNNERHIVRTLREASRSGRL